MHMSEMEVMMIPTRGQETLVFPRELIYRVYPYAPTLDAEEASEYVVGSMLLENEKIPVVDFEFSTRKTPVDENNRRLVLISTITSAAAFHRYALISYGQPRLIQLAEAQLHLTEHEAKSNLIADFISLTGREETELAILDIPAFEAQLKMR